MKPLTAYRIKELKQKARKRLFEKKGIRHGDKVQVTVMLQRLNKPVDLQFYFDQVDDATVYLIEPLRLLVQNEPLVVWTIPLSLFTSGNFKKL